MNTKKAISIYIAGLLELQTRFLKKTNKTSDAECWLWTGSINSGGYGCIEAFGEIVAASRVSWILHRGQIPKNLCVLHKCDVRSCVNPGHLFLGTHAENMADMRNKGRGWWKTKPEIMPHGERHYRSSITDEIASKIVSLSKTGMQHSHIAQKVNATIFTVRGVIYGISWKHIPR